MRPAVSSYRDKPKGFLRRVLFLLFRRITHWRLITTIGLSTPTHGAPFMELLGQARARQSGWRDYRSLPRLRSSLLWEVITRSLAAYLADAKPET